MSQKKERPAEADYKIHVVGASRASVRDMYHRVLRWSWSRTLAMIAVVYLGANALFAVAYRLSHGVANMKADSFLDAFFFSVQTMGTIGYGALFPQSVFANVLMVAESLFSLLLTAITAGLIFAKFSRSTARLTFSRHAVVGPVNGQSTLSFRIGNERGNQIVNAEIRVVLVKTETTHEGKTFYRMLDLPLTRERALSLSRSWTVMHVIDERSPLAGQKVESLREMDAELHITVVGLDDTFMQTVHAGHRYLAREILWRHRHADVLSERPNGDIVLDLTRFHEVESLDAAP